MGEKFLGIQEEELERGGRYIPQARYAWWRPKTDMYPGQVTKEISKVEWRIWQEHFECFAQASTEDGEPTENLKKNALASKLDTFWYERFTQAINKRIKDITFDEIIAEISRTIEVRYPKVTAQADLFRISKAEGKTANHMYAYANFDSLTPEKIKIIITISALDEKDKKIKKRHLKPLVRARKS